jgi:hypothetical protein
MRLDPDQLEWIVREVVRRLTNNESSGPLPSAGRAWERGPSYQNASNESSSISCSDRVITLSHLDGQLNGVARLYIAQRAVITPAARDLLKERGIELVRGDKS